MKTRILMITGITLSLLCAGRPMAAADVTAIDAKIKMAADILLVPADRQGETKKGFMLLIEAIVMAAPDAKFPKEFATKIAAAKQIFESQSILEEKGAALLRGAWQLVTAGKEFQMPAGISNIDQAVEHCRKRIDSARASLKQGKIDECSRALLEVAIMIVTPMIAGPEK
jgi:hypothetical protein